VKTVKREGDEAYLIWAELEHVLLIGNKSADFHREVSVSLGLNKRKLPVLEGNVVLPLEEVIDWNGLSLGGTSTILVSPVERDLLGITTCGTILRIKDKSLDRIGLLQIRCHVMLAK
jgi:hypothetical protein